MKILILLILIILNSCANFRRPSSEAPSWVQSLREGEGSLKVINGDKLFFRRLMRQEDMNANQTCEKAIDGVVGDLKVEYPEFQNLPYTLELVFFDDGHKDCAVTVSISKNLSSKLEEIKAIKKRFQKENSDIERQLNYALTEKSQLDQKYNNLQKYIRQNSYLFSKINELTTNIEEARQGLIDSKNKAQKTAITGLTKKQFDKIIKHTTSIDNIANSSCWDTFRSMSVSIHGTLHVCWTSSSHYSNPTIIGFCHTPNGGCFRNLP